MAPTTADPAPSTTPDPAHPRRGARVGRRRRVVVSIAAVAGLALAGACSSSDDTVATGPSTSANPESPAADNPTSTTTTSVVISGPGSTVTVPTTATSPTTSPEPAASTSTSVTSVPPASSVPGPVDPVAGVTAQVFWVRAPGDTRVIDIPGYQDPTSGPLPLVLYGSVTNNGSATVVRPYVTASWLDAGGTSAATFSADVVAPGTTSPLAFLGPGESGDVIIVITDSATATQLAALTPELTAAAR